MATTRIIPMHINKGKTLAQCLTARTDYAKNPEKTDNGQLVSSFMCDPALVDNQFLLSKKIYEQKTGRKQKNDIIAYQVRQAFKPGEVTSEMANRIGYELAEKITKGNNAFIVATHIDRTKNIVNELYNHKILTPAEYKASKGKKNYDISKSNGIWTNSQVLRTLQDERYTGMYIMGKREVVSIGSIRTKPKDENEWYKIPDNHESIVSKEVFDDAQNQIRKFKCPKKNKYKFPLKSRVVCGICGHVMYRTYKKDHSFRCRHTFGVEDFPCSGLEVREADINDTLLTVIKKQAEIVLNTSNVFDFEGFEAKSANQEIYGEQIAHLNNQKRSLYSKLFDKEISLEEYNQQKAEIDKALFPLTSSFSKLSEETENLKRSQQATKERKKIATDVSEADSVTSELVELLIEKILVYPNEQIELVFKTNDFIG